MQFQAKGRKKHATFRQKLMNGKIDIFSRIIFNEKQKKKKTRRNKNSFEGTEKLIFVLIMKR